MARGQRCARKETEQHKRARALHVVLQTHDGIAVLQERLSCQRLCEEIRVVVVRADLVHLDGPLLVQRANVSLTEAVMLCFCVQ